MLPLAAAILIIDLVTASVPVQATVRAQEEKQQEREVVIVMDCSRSMEDVDSQYLAFDFVKGLAASIPMRARRSLSGHLTGLWLLLRRRISGSMSWRSERSCRKDTTCTVLRTGQAADCMRSRIRTACADILTDTCSRNGDIAAAISERWTGRTRS